MSAPCENCENTKSQEVWFDNGERKYSKRMCSECVVAFQEECKELSCLIKDRVIQNKKSPKPWWERLFWFMRKDAPSP